MVIFIILLIIFLLLFGTVLSVAFAKRSMPGDRAPIYYNETFLQLINLLLIPMVIIFIVLLIMNWKITLTVAFIAWIFGGNILKKISEYIIVWPLYKLLIKEK